MTKKKKLLLALLAVILLFAALVVYASFQVCATSAERIRTLAGDDLILQPIGSVHHAITIRRPPRDVWPWLAQMGSGRAGWYSYDFIDNGATGAHLRQPGPDVARRTANGDGVMDRADGLENQIVSGKGADALGGSGADLEAGVNHKRRKEENHGEKGEE